MDIAVRCRHLDIPSELHQIALEKASHLERFLDGTQRAEVLFSRDHAALTRVTCAARSWSSPGAGSCALGRAGASRASRSRRQ